MKEELKRILDYIEADEKKGWQEGGKKKNHIYNDIKKVQEWLDDPEVYVMVQMYRGLFDEDPQVFWNVDDCITAQALAGEKLDIKKLKDGSYDIAHSDNYVNWFACKVRPTPVAFDLEGWKDKKCSSKGCWNRREPGIIYCLKCMHGSPERLPDEIIATLKAAGVE